LIHFCKRMEVNHGRVIIHIDMDCYYAQVEMNKRPELRERPMGIQQKNIVVTSNYPARALGVRKCMSIVEAKETCPELVLINGEDLAEYRSVSVAVTATLCETGSQVERLGLDENWLDVTQMVKVRRKEEGHLSELRGHVFGELSCDEDCECVQSLKVGSVIAEELRKVILDKHGLTSSAGISYNKMLSKLVGSINKPNDQTVLAAAGILELLTPDKLVNTIQGVGERTEELLRDAGILTLQQLREADVEAIVKAGVPRTRAEAVKQLVWGKDDREVKMTERPASVGLEERYEGIQSKEAGREKLGGLLVRLVDLLKQDGRKPTNIKVTIRDKDKIVKKFHKESRTAKISPRLFMLENNALQPKAVTEILTVCVGLLGKMVDFSSAFQITLLGLSVTDFLEQVEKKSSIKNFFISPVKEDGVPLSVPTRPVRRTSLFKDESEEDIKIKQEVKEEGDMDQKSKDEVSSAACPKDYHPEVWSDLPLDIKKEILVGLGLIRSKATPRKSRPSGEGSKKSPGEMSSTTGSTWSCTSAGDSMEVCDDKSNWSDFLANDADKSTSAESSADGSGSNAIKTSDSFESAKEIDVDFEGISFDDNDLDIACAKEVETRRDGISSFLPSDDSCSDSYFDDSALETSASVAENETSAMEAITSAKDCDTSGTENVVYKCPAGYDAEVFDQLPEDIKKEVAERKVTPGYKLTPPGLRNDLKRKKISPNGSKAKQSNTILNYFSRN